MAKFEFAYTEIMYQVQIKGRGGMLLCFLQFMDAHIQPACPIFMCDLLVIDFIRQGLQLQKFCAVLPGFSAR